MSVRVLGSQISEPPKSGRTGESGSFSESGREHLSPSYMSEPPNVPMPTVTDTTDKSRNLQCVNFGMASTLPTLPKKRIVVEFDCVSMR